MQLGLAFTGAQARGRSVAPPTRSIASGSSTRSTPSTPSTQALRGLGHEAEQRLKRIKGGELRLHTGGAQRENALRERHIDNVSFRRGAAQGARWRRAEEFARSGRVRSSCSRGSPTQAPSTFALALALSAEVARRSFARGPRHPHRPFPDRRRRAEALGPVELAYPLLRRSPLAEGLVDGHPQGLGVPRRGRRCWARVAPGSRSTATTTRPSSIEEFLSGDRSRSAWSAMALNTRAGGRRGDGRVTPRTADGQDFVNSLETKRDLPQPSPLRHDRRAAEVGPARRTARRFRRRSAGSRSTCTACSAAATCRASTSTATAAAAPTSSRSTRCRGCTCSAATSVIIARGHGWSFGDSIGRINPALPPSAGPALDRPPSRPANDSVHWPSTSPAALRGSPSAFLVACSLSNPPARAPQAPSELLGHLPRGPRRARAGPRLRHWCWCRSGTRCPPALAAVRAVAASSSNLQRGQRSACPGARPLALGLDAARHLAARVQPGDPRALARTSPFRPAVPAPGRRTGPWPASPSRPAAPRNMIFLEDISWINLPRRVRPGSSSKPAREGGEGVDTDGGNVCGDAELALARAQVMGPPLPAPR